MLLRLAPMVENISGRLSLPGAGVIVVEATKQVYRLVGVRRPRRALPELAPVLTPALAPRPFGSEPFGSKPFGSGPFGSKPFGSKPFGTVPLCPGADGPSKGS